MIPYADQIFTALTGEFAEYNALLQGHDLADDIEAVHPLLGAVAGERQIIRDVVQGSRAVKQKGQVYLPMSRQNQDILEYDRIKCHTVFFPAAARTAQGKKGLMMARNVELVAPALLPIANTITNELASVLDMAGDVIFDTLQTNFTGVLVDFKEPASGQVPNARDAISQGYRPYVHVFPAETILWIDYYEAFGARMPRRIVVREAYDRILELRVDAGVYWQRVWEVPAEGGKYAVTAMARPTVDGKTLDRIPWVTVSDNTKPYPQPSVLRDIAELNLDHYRAESMIANLAIFGSAVVPYVTGIDLQPDPSSQTGAMLNPQISIATGGILVLTKENSRAEFMEPKGRQAKALADRAEEISQMMAKVGSRVLASDKAAPENENVVLIRNMGEDANIASLSDSYGRRISTALSWAAWMLDPRGEPFRGDEATFTLNTDFGNDSMDGPMLTAWTAAFQAGAISHQTYLEGLQDAGRVKKTLNIQDEIDRVAEDIADRPPVTPPAVTPSVLPDAKPE